MKVTKTPCFSPITITLETKEEYEALLEVFNNAEYHLSRYAPPYKDWLPKKHREMKEMIQNESRKTF